MPVRDDVQKPGVFRFGVGTERPALAYTRGNPETKQIYVRVDLDYSRELGWVTQDGIRQVLLHETGHALGLKFAQAEGENDPYHYRGTEPSVMGTELAHASTHLGQPEIAAYADLLN
jgi:hypothetical protein